MKIANEGIKIDGGNTSDKIYRDVLKACIHWDKRNSGKGKGELFMHIHCPRIRPERKT